MASDESDHLRLMLWDGSACVYNEEIEATMQQVGSFPALNFDVAWEAESGDGLAVWTRHNSNSVRFLSWPAGGTPSAGSAAFGANMLDRIHALRLTPLPGTDRILMTVNTASGQLRYTTWEGDQFLSGSPVVLANSMGSNESLPFDAVVIPGASP
jgi:hypothetical protein